MGNTDVEKLQLATFDKSHAVTRKRRPSSAVYKSERRQADTSLTHTPYLTVLGISHHIEMTDAGLDGLCIREINVYSYKFIIRKIANILHYGSRCHGDLLCSHTVYPDLTKTYLDGF